MPTGAVAATGDAGRVKEDVEGGVTYEQSDLV